MWPVMFALFSYDMQNRVMLSVMDASNMTSERRVANYYYYYYYYYYLPQFSFPSVTVVFTLVTNKNKYT